MPETRRFRISAANIGPNQFHQSRTVSWLICNRSVATACLISA